VGVFLYVRLEEVEIGRPVQYLQKKVKKVETAV
jgi:hypothetical protein